jgi:probable HAF family extracellular repeat protein
MQFIGTLGGLTSEAFGVSADGSVVVGRSTNAGNFRRAFRWTAAGGMQDLGTLGGFESAAYDVSADGSVVVGDSTTTSGMTRAFRWTASTGMQDLTAIYANSIGGDSYLQYANAVSGNGLHIVGYGYNRRNNRYEGYKTNP